MKKHLKDIKNSVLHYKKETPLINRMFTGLLVVMVLATFLTAFVTSINSSFIGAYYNKNGSGLAAISLSLTAISFIDIFAAVLTTGTQAKTAGALANVDKKRANKFVSAGFFLALIVGAVFFFIYFFATEGVALRLSGSIDEDVKIGVINYLKGFSICLPFYVINGVIRPTVILDGNRKLVVFSLIAIIGFTILGDFINVTYLNGGIFGIGVSTSIAYIVSTLLLLSHFFLRKKSILRISHKYFDRHIAWELIKRGSINITKTVANSLFQLYTNVVLLQIGGQASLTILGIQASCFAVVNSIVNGVYDCGFILNHVCGAEQDNDATERLHRLLMKFAVIFVGIVSIIFTALSYQIALSYETDSALITELTVAIACSIAVLPFEAIETIAIVFMPFKECNIAFVLRILVLPVIFTSILGFLIGGYGFWIGKAIAVIFYIPLHLMVARIKYGHFPKTMIEMYFMPKNYGYNNETTLRGRIGSHEDIVRITNNAQKYCKRLNINERDSARLLNTIKIIGEYYDKTKEYDRYDQYSEILVYIKDNKLYIRARDSLEKEYFEEIIEEINKIFHIKKIKKDDNNYSILNAIKKYTKSIEYVNILNVNNYLLAI
ncbi:MAG: hypothetical protein MJ213_05125 [Bacilli bacterium]|nr:hypothetical protein [Bacilli bacterium]